MRLAHSNGALSQTANHSRRSIAGWAITNISRAMSNGSAAETTRATEAMRWSSSRYVQKPDQISTLCPAAMIAEQSAARAVPRLWTEACGVVCT
jgi:hypothetical protein